MKKIITFTIISFVSTLAIAGSESGTGEPASNDSSQSSSASSESSVISIENLFQSILQVDTAQREELKKQKEQMLSSCMNDS